MKNPSSLPRILQGIFLLLEILIATMVVIMVSMVFLDGWPLLRETQRSDRFQVKMGIGEVSLSIPDEEYELTVKGHRPEGTRIEDVRGYIKTSNPEVAKDYVRAVRPALAATLLFWGAVGMAICELFRRVFKQVGRGQSFTPANVKNVHRIGVVILAATLGAAFIGGWTKYSMARFVATRMNATGIEVHSEPQARTSGFSVRLDDFLLHFDLQWLLAGLMILALGEAFRQGLKLQEESEFTI